MQQRIESSRLGRALISALLLVTLASIVVVNLPGSKLRREALRAGGPYLNATGLDQSWKLFAPNPRRATIGLRARVEYANGETTTWRLPSGGNLVGSYWDYHWQKWLEFVVDDRHADLWKPAAEFIARDSRRNGQRPVRVTLIRLTSINYPPGRQPDHGPRVAAPYYSVSTR